MPAYHFALHDAESRKEYLGFMDLADDTDAIEFGRETIQMILQEAEASASAESPVMEITEGSRAVAALRVAVEAAAPI